MYSVTFLKRMLRIGQTYYEIKDMIEKIDIKDASIAEEVRKQMSVVGKKGLYHGVLLLLSAYTIR